MSDALMAGGFSLANFAAMLGWLLLIVVPNWRGVAQTYARLIAPVLLSVAYLVLIGIGWHDAPGGFGSLADVATLFSTRIIILAGWLHYLAFDLFVGAWIARHARAEAISHWLVIPILLLTFLFGPIGFLAFHVIRLLKRAAERRGGMAPVSRVIAHEPVLMAGAFVFLLALLALAAAASIDPRQIGDVGVWDKPLKFAAALALYLATLGWFMPLAGPAFRQSLGGRFVVWGALIPSIAELSYIAWRASRAEASHFNVGTPIAETAYALMGLGAVTLTAASPVLAWGIACAHRGTMNAYVLSVVIGLSLTFLLGGADGALMSAHGAHSVGVVVAGAASLPLFGWSLAIGDLRPGHFLGIHANQILPMIGVLAATLFARHARTLVWGATGLYCVVTVGLTVQALVGLPLWRT